MRTYTLPNQPNYFQMIVVNMCVIEEKTVAFAIVCTVQDKQNQHRYNITKAMKSILLENIHDKAAWY